MIDPAPFAHPDLSWLKRKLRNELAAIARGDFTSRWIDYRRIYLTNFMVMVEAVNYQVRQHLLVSHDEKRIKLTDKQRKLLFKEAGTRSYERFKVIWKTYAQHFDKKDLVKVWFGDDRIVDLKDTIEKRNLTVHPKTYPDLRLTDEDLAKVQRANKWFQQMTLYALSGEYYRETREDE